MTDSSAEDLKAKLGFELFEAEQKAWEALAHGKYQMFGYWAAIHVHLRKLAGQSHEPSPFKSLVTEARKVVADRPVAGVDAAGPGLEGMAGLKA